MELNAVGILLALMSELMVVHAVSIYMLPAHFTHDLRATFFYVVLVNCHTCQWEYRQDEI